MTTPHRRYGNMTTNQRAASPRYMACGNGDSMTGLQDVSETQVRSLFTDSSTVFVKCFQASKEKKFKMCVIKVLKY